MPIFNEIPLGATVEMDGTAVETVEGEGTEEIKLKIPPEGLIDKTSKVNTREGVILLSAEAEDGSDIFDEITDAETDGTMLAALLDKTVDKIPFGVSDETSRNSVGTAEGEKEGKQELKLEILLDGLIETVL